MFIDSNQIGNTSGALLSSLAPISLSSPDQLTMISRRFNKNTTSFLKQPPFVVSSSLHSIPEDLIKWQAEPTTTLTFPPLFLINSNLITPPELGQIRSPLDFEKVTLRFFLFQSLPPPELPFLHLLNSPLHFRNPIALILHFHFTGASKASNKACQKNWCMLLVQ
jgi:hypothetical protein